MLMPNSRAVAASSLILLAVSFSQAAEPSTPDFQREVLPILQSHCVRCHGPKKQESRLRLDTISTDLVNDRAAAENWHEVLNVLNAGEMPPEDEKSLSPAQRKTLTEWISKSIRTAVDAQRDTSGRVVLRRLNRVEYQNTMFDLLGLEMDYARDLPPDAISASGFQNEGRALQMSALQLEYYLDTARRALEKVIVSGPAPQVFHHEFTESNVKGWLGKVDRHNVLGRRQQFLATMPKDYPEEGEFLVRVNLTAELKPDKGFPILEVAVGYRPDTKILFREAGVVEIKSPDEQVLEFRGRLENHPLPVRGQGKFPGLVVRCRNLYDDGTPLSGKGKGDKKRGTVFPDEPHLPTITIRSVTFDGPVFEQWPPAVHRRILFDSEKRDSDEAAYVAEILPPFMKRAFRRPVEPAEVDRMVSFFKTIRPEFSGFEDAIRETLAMILIRPDFLYLMEPAGDRKRPIADWELASRLSYFLWSTMPGRQLTELAEQGTLQDEAKLAAEVDRLLQDPRSARFTDQFTSQWLHLDGIDSVAVSRDFYPKFQDELKTEMRRETQAFFAELLRENLSALNLLSSDFAMLNEPLARHYGIARVWGREFRRVDLQPEQHRGGLLGQASILLSNSTGEDSHAVRRAVWIRDRLLNDPPAPPPPDVPDLDEADPEFRKLSIREQLKIHREKEACASCHQDIDPWGIALENFDAVGLWRDEVRRRSGRTFESQPVEAVAAFPDGLIIRGVDDLKEHLTTDRRNEFARSLVTRLLTYALGRRLELSDQDVIDDLTKNFMASGFQLRQLIHSIVASEPFRTK